MSTKIKEFLQECREKRDFEQIKEVIFNWKHYWMNQTQNSKEDFDNYYHRAFGIDANMQHSLASDLEKNINPSKLIEACEVMLESLMYYKIMTNDSEEAELALEQVEQILERK